MAEAVREKHKKSKVVCFFIVIFTTNNLPGKMFCWYLSDERERVINSRRLRSWIPLTRNERSFNH